MGSAPSRGRAALQQALVASDVRGTTFANLGTAGTAIAVPAGAHSIMFWADGGPARIDFDTAGPGASDSGYLIGSTQYVFGLHSGVGSVALRASSGSIPNIYVNWVLASKAPSP